MDLSPSSKKAVLHVCYQAVRTVAPRHGTHDPLAIANLGEVMAGKIEQYIKAMPTDNMMEFEAPDADTYDYFCDILDEIQKTFPFMNRFNVKLHLERVVKAEAHEPVTQPTGDTDEDIEF